MLLSLFFTSSKASSKDFITLFTSVLPGRIDDGDTHMPNYKIFDDDKAEKQTKEEDRLRLYVTL